ncbi:MAG: hypothetical protein U0790_18380 [Isosphaeraceae bacterium]
MSKVEATSKKQGGPCRPRRTSARLSRRRNGKIPAKYEHPATSGLEAEVKEESNTFNFTLTD